MEEIDGILELVEQLRASTTAFDTEVRNSRYIRLHYADMYKRNQAQFLLQKQGWAAYPVGTKSYTLEIFLGGIAPDELVARRPTGTGDTLKKHLSDETPKLLSAAEETNLIVKDVYGKSKAIPVQAFYEIKKDIQNKWVIMLMGGQLGTQRIQLGFDADELKFEIERIREYGYLNIWGTWSEKWTDADGKKTERFSPTAILVTIKLKDGKRDGEIIDIDPSEYVGVVEQLIKDKYRLAVRRKSGEEGDDLETWLASDKMNVR